MKLSNLNGGAIVVYGLPVQLILDWNSWFVKIYWLLNWS
jgi:hypothetical protein